MHALVGRTLETGAAAYIDAVAVKGKESHGETLSLCRSIPRYVLHIVCKQSHANYAGKLALWVAANPLNGKTLRGIFGI